MKIIDILNKIANAEELPYRIKYNNKVYIYKQYDVCYGRRIDKGKWVKEEGYVAEENRTYYYLKHSYQNLNDEVEILDEDKKIEEITIRENTIGFPNGEWTPRNMDRAFAFKINELVREVNRINESK